MFQNIQPIYYELVWKSLTYVYSLFQFSACNCNAQGSSSSSCSDTGVCTCNANIGGDKCDACNAGLFNFPTCSGKKY